MRFECQNRPIVALSRTYAVCLRLAWTFDHALNGQAFGPTPCDFFEAVGLNPSTLPHI